MTLDPKLAATLDMIAAAGSRFSKPWWIIGSVAAMLIGLEDQPGDVDLLLGLADARMLLNGWGQAPLDPVPSPLFASDLFGRSSAAPMPVEVMAGLRVRGQPLVPATRMALAWGNRQLFVPDGDEQIAILRMFGRDKDLRRAERLEALISKGHHLFSL